MYIGKCAVITDQNGSDAVCVRGNLHIWRRQTATRRFYTGSECSVNLCYCRIKW